MEVDGDVMNVARVVQADKGSVDTNGLPSSPDATPAHKSVAKSAGAGVPKAKLNSNGKAQEALPQKCLMLNSGKMTSNFRCRLYDGSCCNMC